MHQTLKRVVERASVLSGFARVARVATRRRALVLMYHNIVPDDASVVGDRSLHLAQGQFSRQLDYLRATCDVVSLAALVDGTPARSDRCRVAITFDDAYVGAVSLGVDELIRRDLPATIFVPPGLLGEETWWDLLGASPNGLRDDVRTELLQAYRGEGAAIRRAPQWAATASSAALRPEQRIADEARIKRVAAQRGITIGSHTWSHPNLAALDDEILDAELRRSRDWLAERFASFVPYVTYPYGLSSPRVEDAARHAGYVAAFRAGGGWIPADAPNRRYSLTRFDVSAGLSLDGFRLRLAGLGLA
jgi:peptidoglycan/xylan/chitin deacetylase (PgdA/CDA1 family)